MDPFPLEPIVRRFDTIATSSSFTPQPDDPLITRFLRRVTFSTRERERHALALTQTSTAPSRRLRNWLYRRARREEEDRIAYERLRWLFSNRMASSPQPAEPSKLAQVPPYKPKKVCIACCSETTELEQPLIRTCQSCTQYYCVECIGAQLSAYVVDYDARYFPPKCHCQAIIPLQVFKPFIDASVVAEYRKRFDEWSTAFPLYCPVLTCSELIHDRDLSWEAVMRYGTQLVDNQIIQCPNGHNFCSTCRHDHKAGVECVLLEYEMAHAAAIKYSLKKWGYKQCPKCRTGVKRMFGCAHILCQCGAHWCWMCERGIVECHGNDACDDYADIGFEGECEVDAEHQEGQVGDASMAVVPSASTSPLVAVSDTEDLDRNLDAMNLPINHHLALNDDPGQPGDSIFGRCLHGFVIFDDESLGASSQRKIAQGEDADILMSTKDMQCHRCWKPLQPFANFLETYIAEHCHESWSDDYLERQSLAIRHYLLCKFGARLDWQDSGRAETSSWKFNVNPAWNWLLRELAAEPVAMQCAVPDCHLLVCDACAVVLTRRARFEGQEFEVDSEPDSDSGPALLCNEFRNVPPKGGDVPNGTDDQPSQA